MNQAQITNLESPVLVHLDESAPHENPSNPSTLNCGGLSWEQE